MQKMWLGGKLVVVYTNILSLPHSILPLSNYQSSQQASQGGSGASFQGGRKGSSSGGIGLKNTTIVKPDTKQMMPFKPSSTSGTELLSLHDHHTYLT